MNTPSNIQPPDPYKEYKVEGVEKIKEIKKDKQGDEEPVAPSKPTQSWLGGYILLLMEKIIDFFSKKQRPLIATEEIKTIRDHLIQLHQILDQLKEIDCSQDIDFLHSLSRIWNLVIEDNFSFRRASDFAIAFRSLFRAIQNYPEGEEYTLGYYLTQHPNTEWIPFPYMDLLRKLHQEYIHRPQESHLIRWSIEIDYLIELLGMLEYEHIE